MKTKTYHPRWYPNGSFSFVDTIIEEHDNPQISSNMIIPHGSYCYQIISLNEDGSIKEKKVCPYWHNDDDLPIEQSAFCRYMNRGDHDHNVGTNHVDTMLWDMVKICDVNNEKEDPLQLLGEI